MFNPSCGAVRTLEAADEQIYSFDFEEEQKKSKKQKKKKKRVIKFLKKIGKKIVNALLDLAMNVAMLYAKKKLAVA